MTDDKRLKLTPQDQPDQGIVRVIGPFIEFQGPQGSIWLNALQIASIGQAAQHGPIQGAAPTPLPGFSACIIPGMGGIPVRGTPDQIMQIIAHTIRAFTALVPPLPAPVSGATQN